MDITIASTIIWGLIWFIVGAGIITVLVFWLFTLIGGLVSGGHEAGIGLGALFGWIAAVIWEIFALYQVVRHVITLIQLIWFPEAVGSV